MPQWRPGQHPKVNHINIPAAKYITFPLSGIKKAVQVYITS